jgi:alkylation response protein AidB-like acyl-CoA dehydrogenase
MDFSLTPEQLQVEKDINEYLEKLITPEVKAELSITNEGGGPDTHPHFTNAIRQMGKDGWLGIGWPKEYGGQGRNAIEQYLFFDATWGYHCLPIPMLALNTVGPALMRHGTDEQKKRFLPPILRGELHIAIGYTEPDAGSDLASLRTKAERDGDDYVINGNKIFTSMAHFCDYVWIAARTDPDAKKHKGISIFMLDINTPGITVDPLVTMGGLQSNFTYYDNVRVPKDCLIGEENKGWSYINSQLAHERLMLGAHSRQRRALEETMAWAKKHKFDGKPVIEQPWVKALITELSVDIEVLKMFNYWVAWQLTQGIEPFADASMTKIFGSELMQKVNNACTQIMGSFGGLQPGSDLAPSGGRIQREFLSMRNITFGGGANEILRDVIAMFALGMPPSR